MRRGRIAVLWALSWVAMAAAAAADPSFAAVQDSTGRVLGPLVDYQFTPGLNPGFAVFTVAFDGKLAVLQANRTTLSGAGVSQVVWFATPDCSGQAYLSWDPSYITPPSSIGGPANTVYVGDAAPVQAHPVIQSRYVGAGSGCQPYPPIDDYLVPVAAVGNLAAVPPFTLVTAFPSLAAAVPAVGGGGLLALAALLAAAAIVFLGRRGAP